MKFNMKIYNQYKDIDFEMKNNTYNLEKDTLRFNLKDLTDKEKRIYRSIRNKLKQTYEIHYTNGEIGQTTDLDVFKLHLENPSKNKMNARYMEDFTLVEVTPITSN